MRDAIQAFAVYLLSPVACAVVFHVFDRNFLRALVASVLLPAAITTVYLWMKFDVSVDPLFLWLLIPILMTMGVSGVFSIIAGVIVRKVRGLSSGGA